MKNNDILRRLRYVFDFNDTKMIAIFHQADLPVNREQVSAWLKKDDAEDEAMAAHIVQMSSQFPLWSATLDRIRRMAPFPCTEAAT